MGGHFLKEIPEQGTGWVPFVYLPEVALVLVREPLVVGSFNCARRKGQSFVVKMNKVAAEAKMSALTPS